VRRWARVGQSLGNVMVSGVPTTISVRDLRKSYGDLRAVDGVTFEVERGEFFGILGPNGAGKTTTLEIIEGLRRPDGGEVSVLGMTPWPRNPALLPRMGVQLQASSFFEHLTAREQLRTFAALYGIPAERADAMLEVVGLTDMAATRTEKLSGGQAQRLSIACALVHGPDVLFLDEPTGALDPQARRNLWDLLRAISAEGHTVVLTTHHMDEAETLCDRVAIMDHGQILKIGSPAALVRELDQPVRISIEAGQLSLDEARALVAAAGRAGDSLSGDGALGDGAMVADDGVSLTIVTNEPASVLAALADRQALAGLQVRGGTLEDVFLHLTGREYRA
jgi:ABC-2 type transport system ATP-binding protein